MAKELYFSESFEALKERCHINIPKGTTYSKCLDAMEKLNKRVIDYNKIKDEEMEFHSLHRFLMFSTFFSNVKKNINNNISDQKTQQRQKHLHSVAKKYLGRYEELGHILSERYVAREKSKNSRVTPVANLSEVRDTTSSRASVNSSKSVTPTISEINVKGAIKCNHLFALINDKTRKVSLLIIDVRPARDFKTSHLVYNQLLSIPEELIEVGLSAEKLKAKLSGDALELWSKRGDVDVLVLMDWSSTSSSPAVSKLFALRSIMRQWDPMTTYKSNPIILEGGYEELLERYPQITTNPKVEIPRPPVSESIDELMDLDYPMEELEPQRPKSVPPKPKPPEAPDTRHSAPAIIDRSTKPQPKLTNENLNSIMDELADSLSDDEVPDVSHTPTTVEKEASFEPIATSDTVRMEESSDDETPPDISVDPKQVDSGEPTRPDPELVENLRKLKPTNLNNNERPVEPRNRTIDEKGDDTNRSWSRSTANDNDISHLPLKKDGSSGGILRRTSSSPNIAKLRDDEPSGHVPAFSRANKPYEPRKQHFVYNERADCVYGKPAPGLTGLKNFANNCYMNSIVQCLNNTEPLVNALMRLEDSPAFNYSGRLKGRIAQEMIQAFRYMWSGEVKIYSIRELKNLMGEIKDIFKGSMHQDSNEFLIILLEHLHEDLNMPAEVGTLIGAEEQTGEKAWGEFRRKNCSVIQQLFYGQHKSTVTCCTCGHASATFEQFFNLFVPIPSNQNTVSLNDCIQLYMSGERISGWKCPECKTERNAMKKIDISRLPPVLVIALKRFTQEDDSWLHKKENLVTYPLDNLDMSRFTVPGSEQRNRVYSLYAMSTHSGTLQSGHYRAICKSFNTKRWYMFDDQSVEPLSESAVQSNSEVYILFYIAKKPS